MFVFFLAYQTKENDAPTRSQAPSLRHSAHATVPVTPAALSAASTAAATQAPATQQWKPIDTSKLAKRHRKGASIDLGEPDPSSSGHGSQLSALGELRWSGFVLTVVFLLTRVRVPLFLSFACACARACVHLCASVLTSRATVSRCLRVTGK